MKKILVIIISLVVNINLYANSNEKSEKQNALALLAVDNNNPEEQKMMETLKLRRSFLNWHNYTGWLSVGLMGATLVTAPKGKQSSTHKWLGIAASSTYLTSAALAMLAPKPDEFNEKNNIFIHKVLMYVHAPALVLAMYSGFKAHKQRKDGKKLDSFADLHKAFAGVATVSFGLAAVSSMDWTMSLFPTSKKEIAWLVTKKF